MNYLKNTKKAMKANENYMWNFAKGSGIFEVLTNILEMFESSASDGLSIREVVGNDIAEFADSLLSFLKKHGLTN